MPMDRNTATSNPSIPLDKSQCKPNDDAPTQSGLSDSAGTKDAVPTNSGEVRSEPAHGNEEKSSQAADTRHSKSENGDKESSSDRGSRKRQRNSVSSREGKSNNKAQKLELKSADRVEFLKSVQDSVTSTVRNHAKLMQEVKSEYLLTRTSSPLFWKPKRFTPEMLAVLTKQRENARNEVRKRVDKCNSNFSKAIRSLQSSSSTASVKDDSA